MKIIKLFFISLFILCTLSACENQMFGIPKSQWKQLNKQQQDEVIRGYNEQQRIQQQNALYLSAIEAAETILKDNS